MRNWKSTIGGAFGALGTALMGIGIVPQLGGSPSTLLTYIALAGFICNAIGIFFGHLFAADAAAVRGLQAQMAVVPEAIDSGNTEMLKKAQESPTQTPKTP